MKSSKMTDLRDFLFILTHFTARACNPDAVLFCGLNGSIGTSSGIVSEAQVIVRAHVDDVLHHSACVPETDRQLVPDTS